MNIDLCMGCMQPKEGGGACPHCGFSAETYEAAPHHLPLETVLNGKYLVGRVLGEGGFGITYLGWDLNLQLKVAIKEYYPNGFVTRGSRDGHSITVLTGQRSEFFRKGMEKFVDEARRLAKFWGLPGIVAVKDYFQENQTAYIVMEFAEGKTLKTVLKEKGGRMEAQAVFGMMRPVMDSLETVHNAGLIHRDISPDNLMTDGKGHVKLIDFGAARDFLSDGEKSLSVMLKPGYSPEEQYRSRGQQGPWTDVYGLCATMYRMITGKVPLESLDRMEEDTLKAPSEMGVSISAAQEAALMKGLAIYKKDRYQSIGELKAALYAEENREERQQEKQGREEKQKSGEEQKLRKDPKRGKEQKPEKEPKPKKGQKTEKEGKRRGEETIRPTGAQKGGQQKRKREQNQTDGQANGKKSLKKFLPAGIAAGLIFVLCILKKDSEPIVWADARMEALVRKGLDRKKGDIMPEELADIEVLEIRGGYVWISEYITFDDGYEIMRETSDYSGQNSENEAYVSILSLKDLKWFPSLRVLRIWGHPLADIGEISNLTELEQLSLVDNSLTSDSLTDMEALSGLSNLVGLKLADNEITELEPLSAFVNLEELNLYNNQIEDVEPLSGLVNLESLSLNNNQIEDVSPLSGLVNLEVLRLSDNQIEDVSPLSGLINLESLYLEGNPVSDLSALSGIPDLDLYLRIDTVEEVQTETQLPFKAPVYN